MVGRCYIGKNRAKVWRYHIAVRVRVGAQEQLSTDEDSQTEKQERSRNRGRWVTLSQSWPRGTGSVGDSVGEGRHGVHVTPSYTLQGQISSASEGLAVW